MKTLLITTILAMTLTSFTSRNPIDVSNETKTSEQLGEKIILALQHQSEAEYLSLFPTLDEFYSVMNNNENFYGATLPEAMIEFAHEYNTTLIPAVKRSFSEILKAGEEKGILWREVKFVRAEFRPEDKVGMTVPGIVTFTYKDIQYSLRIEKAIIMNDNWRVGQYLHFK